MKKTDVSNLTQLGSKTPQPASPDEAVLERVANSQMGSPYVVRFAAPEFTSMCPMTGQPDFAHLVIDYVPDRWLVESKSLKLYLGSFRQAAGERHQAKMAAHRRLLVSTRRDAHRCLLANRRPAQGPVADGSRRSAL